MTYKKFKKKKERKRKEFFQKEIPNTVNIYLRLMKRGDLSNHLISYYKMNRATIKWYKTIFFHLLDIVIVNSLIIYKKYFNANITENQ